MWISLSDEVKKALDSKVHSFIASELPVDEKVVSLSIEDVEKEKWNRYMEEVEQNRTLLIKEYRDGLQFSWLDRS